MPLVVLAVVSTVAASALALLGEDELPPWWLFAAAAMVAALAALIPFIRSADERDASERSVVRGAVRNPRPDGRLPKVKDLTPTQFGARRPLIDVAYRRRPTAEAKIVEALGRGEPTVVLGRAMAGKSRMCAQILQDKFPDRDLVHLHSDGIGPLLEAGCPTGAVVWLDDLNEYLAVDSLRSDWVEILRDHNNVILATMRLVEWEKHDHQNQIRSPASKVLDAFTPTWLFYDADEAQRLGETMPSTQDAANVTRYGIGEYLGGGPRYRDRYTAGRAAHPLGVALVRAAVDLRRAGLDPVPLSRVQQLAPHYLTTSNTAMTELPDEAATWALALLDGLPGLIEPADQDHGLVRAGDFILDYLPETGLPEPVWNDIVNGSLTHMERLAIGSFATARGRSILAIPLIEQALSDTERVLGAHHHLTLSSKSDLAYAYRAAGQLERAVELSEQNLTDAEWILGADHPDTLSARSDLASACASVGQLERAIKLSEQNLIDTERILGPDHPQILTSRNILADAYASAGQLKRAIPLFEQNLTDAQRILGTDHQGTFSAKNNLASGYRSAGQLERAIPLYEQALNAAERVMGADNPDTLTSRNNLAYAYESVSRFERAIPLFEQTLTDRERVLGADHLDTLNSRSNLASAYRAAGQLERAVELSEQNLIDTERILNSDHPQLLTSRNNLASAYESDGQLERAIPLFEQTLTDRERVLDTDHPATLASRSNLAWAYLSARQLERAIPLFERTLIDTERIHGAEHPDVALTKICLKILRAFPKEPSQ